MKILLFLLLPLSIYSQKAFKQLDSSAFVKQIDAVIKATGKDYVLLTKGQEGGVKYLVYNSSTSSEDQLLLTYYTVMEGENKNLDVTGVKKWNFRSIKANYLTLFPVWNTFVDPSAEKEKLAKSGYKMKGDFSISELDAPVWLMRF